MFHKAKVICPSFQIQLINNQTRFRYSPERTPTMNPINGQTRTNIKPGMTVLIVLKQDQRTGKLTKGIVKELLTKSPNHPHGIKVRLLDGQVGRVKEILNDTETR
jgi:uncharacterized repeat protein (TIGR03833 family)